MPKLWSKYPHVEIERELALPQCPSGGQVLEENGDVRKCASNLSMRPSSAQVVQYPDCFQTPENTALYRAT